MKDVAEMDVSELEELLAQKKKSETDKRKKEKQAYEDSRDKIINMMIQQAADLSAKLDNLKKLTHKIMDEQAEKLEAYGSIRGNSKGGFSITSSDQHYRVVRRRDTVPMWDERGNKGIALVKDFLHDTVKKKDQDTFELLMKFLERNKVGDLEYSRVFSLIQERDRFDDARWKEGLRLLEESYNVTLKAFQYEFKVKDEQGNWVNLPLNFTAL